MYVLQVVTVPQQAFVADSCLLGLPDAWEVRAFTHVLLDLHAP